MSREDLTKLSRAIAARMRAELVSVEPDGQGFMVSFKSRRAERYAAVKVRADSDVFTVRPEIQQVLELL